MRFFTTTILRFLMLAPVIVFSQNTTGTQDSLHHQLIDQFNDSLVNYGFSDFAKLESYIDRHNLQYRTDSAGNQIYSRAQILKGIMLSLSNNQAEALQTFEGVLLNALSQEQKTEAVENMATIFLASNDLSGMEKLLENYKLMDAKANENTVYWELQLAAEKFSKNPKDSALVENYINCLKKSLLYTKGDLNQSVRKMELVRFDPKLPLNTAKEYIEEAKRIYREQPELPIGLPIRIAEAYYYKNTGNMDDAYPIFLSLLRGYQKKDAAYSPNFRTRKTLSDCIDFFISYPNTPKEVVIEAMSLQLKWQANVFDAYQTFKGSILEKQMHEAIQKENQAQLAIVAAKNEADLQRFRFYVSALLVGVICLIFFLGYVYFRNHQKVEQDSFTWLFSKPVLKANANDDQINQPVEEETKNQFVAVSLSEESAFARNLLEKHKGLTPTDVRVLYAIKKGLSTKEIADSLGISIRGVESARYRVRRKLQLDETVDYFNYLNSL